MPSASRHSIHDVWASDSADGLFEGGFGRIDDIVVPDRMSKDRSLTQCTTRFGDIATGIPKARLPWLSPLGQFGEKTVQRIGVIAQRSSYQRPTPPTSARGGHLKSGARRSRTNLLS